MFPSWTGKQSEGSSTLSNMSYCRFENTANDLADCIENWDDVPDDELSSDHERRGKNRLKKMILEIASSLEGDDE